MLEFYTMRTPKARKQHKCCLCNNLIQVGEIYIRESGKAVDFFDECFHPTCNRIVTFYANEQGVDEWDRDEVIEWLSDRYCRDCIHGTDQEDDCEEDTLICPIIREKWRKTRKGEEDAK